MLISNYNLFNNLQKFISIQSVSNDTISYQTKPDSLQINNVAYTKDTTVELLNDSLLIYKKNNISIVSINKTDNSNNYLFLLILFSALLILSFILFNLMKKKKEIESSKVYKNLINKLKEQTNKKEEIKKENSKMKEEKEKIEKENSKIKEEKEKLEKENTKIKEKIEKENTKIKEEKEKIEKENTKIKEEKEKIEKHILKQFSIPHFIYLDILEKQEEKINNLLKTSKKILPKDDTTKILSAIWGKFEKEKDKEELKLWKDIILVIKRNGDFKEEVKEVEIANYVDIEDLLYQLQKKIIERLYTKYLSSFFIMLEEVKNLKIFKNNENEITQKAEKITENIDLLVEQTDYILDIILKDKIKIDHFSLFSESAEYNPSREDKLSPLYKEINVKPDKNLTFFEIKRYGISSHTKTQVVDFKEKK